MRGQIFAIVALGGGLAFGLLGCDGEEALDAPGAWEPGSEAAQIVSEAASVMPQDGLKATYWMQASAEYLAIVDLTYDLARIRLDEALADPSWTAMDQQVGDYAKKPPAVILDVDETVLDNTAYQVWLAVTGETFSTASWQAFVKAEESPALKPALEFTQYAASKGVEVFYVTNRNVKVKQATRANLISEGFPVSDDVDTVLTKAEREEWTSKKETRWAHIAEDYRVLLLIGDNLGDVAEGIYDSPEARLAIVPPGLPLRIGAWLWRPAGLRRRDTRRHLRSSWRHTGFRCMRICADTGATGTRRLTLPRLSLPK